MWQWIYFWLYISLLAYVQTQQVKYPLREDFNLHLFKTCPTQRLLSRCGNSLNLTYLETYFMPIISTNMLYEMDLTLPLYHFKYVYFYSVNLSIKNLLSAA